MASLLLRLEGAVAGRVSTKIFRSTISFLYFNNNLFAYRHDRMMSTTTTTNNNSSGVAAPRLMLPPAFEGGKMVYKFYNLEADRVDTLIKQGEEEVYQGAKLVGSSHGWLAWFNSINNNLFLSNPITGRRIKLHPPLREERRHRLTVSKLILSCSPDEEQQLQNCRALMSLSNNRLSFCTTTATATTSWTVIGHLADEGGFDDFVYSAKHKRFFCITKYNVLQVWDLNDPGSPRIEFSEYIGWLHDGEARFHELLDRSEARPEVRRQNYLVLDRRSDQLFVLRRHIMARVGHHDDCVYVKPMCYGWGRGWDDSYPYKTIGFQVYKVEGWECGGETSKVTYVEERDGSLDGLAMFVGLNHSFAVLAAGFPALKPDSIYFTDAIHEFTPSKRFNEVKDIGDEVGDGEYEELVLPRWVQKNYGGHDIGIFSYENRTISPCYYPCDVQSIKRIMPNPRWSNSFDFVS